VRCQPGGATRSGGVPAGKVCGHTEGRARGASASALAGQRCVGMLDGRVRALGLGRRAPACGEEASGGERRFGEGKARKGRAEVRRHAGRGGGGHTDEGSRCAGMLRGEHERLLPGLRCVGMLEGRMRARRPSRRALACWEGARGAERREGEAVPRHAARMGCEQK
jgi:hypothetical protein